MQTCIQVDLSSSIDDPQKSRVKFGRAVNLLGPPAPPPDYAPPTTLDEPPALPLWRNRLRWYVADAPLAHVCAMHVKAGATARRECPECHDVVRDVALRAAKQIGAGFVAPEVVDGALPQLDWPTAALSVELGRFTRPRRAAADFAADAERARGVLEHSRAVVTSADRALTAALTALADIEARRATELAVDDADGGPSADVLLALAEEEAEAYSDVVECRAILDAVEPTATDLEIAPHVDRVVPIYSMYVSALPLPAERATFFVRAPLGAGKTESVRHLISAAKSLVYVTPRRVLSRDASERLQIQNYEDVGGALPQKCVVTLPSVLRYPLWCDSVQFMMALGGGHGSQPGLVMLLDEVSQLREMWHANLMKKRLRAGYGHFATLVTSAHLVVALDAHLSVADVAWLKSLRDAPTTYATMPVPRGDRAYLQFESVHELRLDLLDWLKDDTHTAWISTTSRRESLVLDELLRDHGIEPLRLDKDTYPAWADDDKRTPISTRLGAHRVVIATPVVTSGVSITGNHFDRVYAFAPARGESVDPDEIRQMTARVRTPSDRVVRVWVDAQAERLPADPESVGAEILTRTGRRAPLNALDAHLFTLKRDGVVSQRLRADVEDAFSLRCVDSKDVCVRLPPPNDAGLKQRAAELKQRRTTCRKRVAASHVEAVMNAADVTKQELKARRRRGESLYYEGERLRIRETYGDVIEDHVEFDAMGTRAGLVKTYASVASILRADSAQLHEWWAAGVASDKLTTLLRGDYVKGYLGALAVHGFGLTAVVLRRVPSLGMICTPDTVAIDGVDITRRIKSFDDPIAWAVLGLRRRWAPYFMLRALVAKLGFQLPNLKTPKPKAVRLIEAEVDNAPLRVPKHAAHLMNLYSNSSRYSYTALYEYEAAEKARLEEKRRAKRKKPPQDRLGARESRAHG